MNLYLGFLILDGIAVIILLLMFVFSFKRRNTSAVGVYQSSLSHEELEEHARKIAIEHSVSQKGDSSVWPVLEMNDNYNFIDSVYKSLNEDVQKKLAIPPAAEWLLDNFYIIEEQVKALRINVSKEDYLKLPVLKSGPMKGHTRIYAVAIELIFHTNGQIDENVISNYLKAYQTHSVLTDREIWIMPSMICLGLIGRIKGICERIKVSASEWRRADQLVEEFSDKEKPDFEKAIRLLESYMEVDRYIDPSFIEHLCYSVRRAGYQQILKYIDESLARHGTAIEEIARKEHNIEADAAVSIGNCITSLKYISSLDWIDIFESASYIEDILREDPDGTYPLMDLCSRDLYRKRIEEIAALYGLSEIHVAREAVELAKSAKASPDTHIGYYITGKGTDQLYLKLGKAKIKNGFSIRNPHASYFGFISAVTLLLVLVFCSYTYINASYYRLPLTLLTAILVIIPASEIVVLLANWLICKVQKPTTFVRLELKDGIPESLSTVVVIPALLTDENRVMDLIENMETHYLSNKEQNIFFVLLGDFKDSSSASTSQDEMIVKAAQNGVKRLNSLYSDGKHEKFFYLHRQRKYNQKQNKWMGWERKRGALLEFNDLLLGSKMTSFSYFSSKDIKLLKIKYVITLDADTILPIGAAKRLIGTMAHPLNKPLIDEKKGIVVDGYALMQPRISIDVESANRSLLSRILTGQEGIDPYSCAISDVYQDFFGEGIFTGKGIYDLKVFQKVVRDAFPDNAILSHDLLEGSYVRTGLISDIELVDSYPSKYHSYTARMHRWVRGDWQLLPWLLGKLYNRNGKKLDNPLSMISRWKIADNMRRSLITPAILLLITAGVCILPRTGLLWLLFAFLVMAFPFIISAVDLLMSNRYGTKRIKRHIPVISGLKASFFQLLLTLVFLPYQAYLMVNAAVITLYRVLISKKNTLLWVTAADVEKGDKNSLKSYSLMMFPSIPIAVAIALLALCYKPLWIMVICLGLMVLWLFSPVIAFLISKNEKEKSYYLGDAEILNLRKTARKTWRYFEEFMNYNNHYLIPDNYQQDPPKGIAPRTSPTNIGLGLLASLSSRDFGYAGIIEMTGTIGNIVNTIEKMDKWNGHLYNWYDTRTLHPLKPRYVSTVDSGNYVCYLITLIQGMEEYLERPIVDSKFVSGIKDTLSLAEIENIEIWQCLEFASDAVCGSTIYITSWYKSLKRIADEFKANASKNPWKAKAEREVKMLLKELGEFFPWVELIKDITDELNRSGSENNELKKILNIIEPINSNVPIIEIPGYYKAALSELKELAEVKVPGKKSKDDTAWIERLNAEMLKGLKNTEEFIARYVNLIRRIKVLSDATSFKPLFVDSKNLFSIGYNIEDNRLTNSYYDLLASEARQTSYIAIARGEVPPKHWFKMGRALTEVDQYKGLVSWTGTMFEYLMPLLIMKRYKNTILDETYSFVIRSQKKYGRVRRIPWGASESGFYSLDINHDYQYKAIGVPWLGLKRGLIEDAVAAPYATFLALMVDPEAAIENIKILEKEGMDGPYGFYEAIDYTRERLPFGMKHAIVKSFMAHHQGMSLLALNNCINEDIMQKRFHNDPVVKAAQLLLQEKVPANVVFTKETKEKVVPFKDVVYKERGPMRRFRQPDMVLPKVHVLSNGNYSVMVTDRGTGYSKTKMAAVTRWKEDKTLDHYGTFFYIRNIDTDSVWCSTFAPFYKMPDSYEVTYTADKIRFKREDGDIETVTDIVVATGDNAEIRRLTFKNSGQKNCVLEITSYFEVVIAPWAADIAHPAFSNLFVSTEYHADKKCIIANRRPRSEGEKTFWACNSVIIDGEAVGDLQYETDRMQFVGRGNNLSMPAAIERNKPLSNTTGPVLDPVMSLRIRVKIEPGKSTAISFLTGIGENMDTITALIDKYSSSKAVDMAFKLALTRSQVEAKYLNLKAAEAENYQDMLSNILFLSPLRRGYEEVSKNRKGQSSLWPYGISGDLPIMLLILKKSDELDILYDVLKAHEYWRTRDIRVDLVVLNEEENSYNHPLYAILKDIVSFSHAHDMINRPGGVYILNRSNMPKEDVELIMAVSRIVFRGEGTMVDQLKIQQRNPLPPPSRFVEKASSYEDRPIKPLELNFFNGIGGFSKDGSEYIIRLEKGNNTPVPWSNIISSPDFGFLVTESGSGYTWSENSRENKLTPWSNDPVSDVQGEILYVQDSETGELWNITPLPIREDASYTITHGFGYSVFKHNSHGIEQEIVQFIPQNERVKLNIITLKNSSGHKRQLILTYYIRPVMGVNDQFSAMHISTSQDESGILLVENNYNEEFKGRIMFVDCSVAERSVTGDRNEFFGWGGVSSPEALSRQSLSNTLGMGLDPCAALRIAVTIEKDSQKEIIFMIGEYGEIDLIRSIAHKYRSVNTAKSALKEIKDYWKNKLGIVKIETPDDSMNLLLNGWLVYQVIACRIWARSAFYQSGGAFGFRDQLQDSLAIAQIWPEIAKEQIPLHARHQFLEGDVQHWWHEPAGKGTRTKFSDDLLWLPYVTAEYIRITGDFDILNISVPFLEDELLKEFEDERYSIPHISQESASLYDHCIRAIEKSLRFGAHGIPLMGSGDWNDGMNTVGNRGQGESVWLGWFLYSVLKKFSTLCTKMGDSVLARSYEEKADLISGAVEENAWDGSWYRRAYFDSGIPLGSIQNSECKIDSIAQAWSVISEGGRKDRAAEAMKSLENYLVDWDSALIKLLAPPFDEGDLEPGYIKGYVPGVRENGGQYTHAAAWTIIAFAMLNQGEKALKLFELVNPVNHTRTNIEYSRYKVEPYVMAADVYAVGPHSGRGGWTWYTGSAGWIYRAGLEYIAGFKKEGDLLFIDPCIPGDWKKYKIIYMYYETQYEIEVNNPDRVSRGVVKVIVDKNEISDKAIKLINDKNNHHVKVIMGKVKEMGG